jgi:hypothetical protein
MVVIHGKDDKEDSMRYRVKFEADAEENSATVDITLHAENLVEATEKAMTLLSDEGIAKLLVCISCEEIEESEA